MVKTTTRRTVPYRRKRDGKTNYRKRLELLKSRKNRLIIRKTNTSIIMQVVSYEADGDKVLVGLTSKKLATYGWKHSGKNLPAAYLTGMLLGKEAAKKGIKEAIVDLGLQTPIKGSRLYAALKGAADAGLDVHASEQVFPAEDRLSGKHIQNDAVAKDFAAVKTKIAQV